MTNINLIRSCLYFHHLIITPVYCQQHLFLFYYLGSKCQQLDFNILSTPQSHLRMKVCMYTNSMQHSSNHNDRVKKSSMTRDIHLQQGRLFATKLSRPNSRYSRCCQQRQFHETCKTSAYHSAHEHDCIHYMVDKKPFKLCVCLC